MSDVSRFCNGLNIRRPKSKANIINESRVKSCLAKFDNGSYSSHVKCVSWHRARGSRWYPADMRAFARAARTALLLWTRVQCAVATSWCIGDAHIHVGVDTWTETMETVENYERVTPRNVDIN